MAKKHNRIEQLKLFQELHDDRVVSYREFSKKDFRGVFENAIDLYPDSAHFIYELIQNADDAIATTVEIILDTDYLIFKHNGSIHFSVTPANDDSDIVGHINSITAIGNSSKQAQENKIGKFGVGFKSVFQYTDSPEIYDDVFKFRIENYIIPVLLNHDNEFRNNGETLFYIPFSDPENDYHDIEQKLCNLNNATLFLKNLKKISWQNIHNGESDSYEKHVIKSYQSEDISCDYLLLSEQSTVTKMWMFSREVTIPNNKGQFPISIGFYLDSEGKLKTDTKCNVSCFFETDETFDSCFVSHAPFLLVKSRAQIKNDSSENEYLVTKLGELLSDVLLELRDLKLLNENIIDIIGDGFEKSYYYYNKLIRPSAIYEPCAKKIKSCSLLLSRNNEYLPVTNIYRYSTADLYDLLNQSQLTEIVRSDTKCDFISSEFSEKKFTKWKELGVKELTPEYLSLNLTETFMASQPLSWVFRLINTITERFRSLSISLKEKKSGFLIAPIILTNQKTWVPPYSDGNLNVYRSTGTAADKDYNIVDESFAQNKFVDKFLKSIDCKEPDKEDYIKTKLLPQCDGDGELDDSDLLNTLKVIYYYSQEIESGRYHQFCDLVSESSIIYSIQNGENYRSKPKDVFIDTPVLKEYVEYSPDLFILNTAFYEDFIKEIGRTKFNSFLLDLHLKRIPAFFTTKRSLRGLSEAQKKFLGNSYYLCTRERASFNKINVEGLDEVLLNAESISLSLSKQIWDWLIEIGIKEVKEEVVDLFYRTSRYRHCPSQLYTLLQEAPWLYNVKHKHVKLSDVTKEELLSVGYTYDSQMYFELNINSEGIDLTEYGLTEKDNQDLKMGKVLSDAGIKTADQLKELLRLKAERDRNLEEREKAKKKNENSRVDSQNPVLFPQRDRLLSSNGKEFTVRESESNESSSKEEKRLTERTEHSKESDEIATQIVKDYKKKVHVAEQRENIVTIDKYSKEWFNTLLELEYGEEASSERMSSKTISISFGKVTKEMDSNRIFVLKNPSKCPIPISLEQIGGIEVRFSFSDREDFIKGFEVASVRDFTLRLKAKQGDIEFLNSIDWNSCTSASIDANNPIKLMGKLITAFNDLGLPDGYNLKDNLKDNVSFVFGPPGTGKTTYIAHRIIDLMDKNVYCKILVLTPTNKACDVLAEKILESENTPTWLGRFVATGSETLEERNLVCERDSRIYQNDCCCIVSTIARLPYDGFHNIDEDARLKDIEWDYVIIDEASMIPLCQVMYAIYRFSPNAEIIIAGDPKQITPIVHEETWKRENIYSMVNLTTFDHPQTEPIDFQVTNLDTQYRSVPEIGYVFSNYAYSGLLHHFRESSSRLPLTFNGKQMKPLTLIPFKVSRMDNVFRPYRLSGSNVHIYSVLLVSEICRFISKEFINQQSDRKLRVGVICPYSAEAQLIEKIIEQMSDLPKQVKITVGTIHGFQGDECDVVFVVLNPPVGIRKHSDKIFLNDENILNVAISRSRDYLVLLYPHEETDGFENLVELNKVGKLMCSDKDAYSYYTSDDVEQIIYGQSYYIENNVFVTTHQLANVYTEAAKQFEIRIDDSSVDVQISK